MTYQWFPVSNLCDLYPWVCMYPSLYCSIECTKSAPLVVILFDGSISKREGLDCSPPAIQWFDLDSCIHFLCLYVICWCKYFYKGIFCHFCFISVPFGFKTFALFSISLSFSIFSAYNTFVKGFASTYDIQTEKMNTRNQVKTAGSPGKSRPILLV